MAQAHKQTQRLAAESGPAADGMRRIDRKSRNENFPVASRLLAVSRRPHVMAFYRFARAADDIADSPSVPDVRKLARLATMKAVLSGEAPSDVQDGEATEVAAATALRESLAETGVSATHAEQMLQAFERDVRQPVNTSWSDLLTYCRYSAAPVGRFLLDLHGELEGRRAIETGRASDALCAALQIINHIQDCKRDWESLGRLYVPLAWLRGAKLKPEVLSEPRSSEDLRVVLDRMLDGVDQLLVTARPLVGLIRDRRLRIEAAVIYLLAKRLAGRLRRADPLEARPRLSSIEKALCAGHGLLIGLLDR